MRQAHRCEGKGKGGKSTKGKPGEKGKTGKGDKAANDKSQEAATKEDDKDVICFYSHRKGHRKKDRGCYLEAQKSKQANAVLADGTGANSSAEPAAGEEWTYTDVYAVTDESHAAGSMDRVTVDRGAQVSICLPCYGSGMPQRSNDHECRLRSATGAKIRHHGSKIVQYDSTEGVVEIDYQVVEATMPLLSAKELNKKGYTTVSGPAGSYFRSHLAQR